ILKAGAAYVPVDPTNPPRRLAYLIEDADAQVVVSSTAGGEALAPMSAHQVRLDQGWPEGETADLPPFVDAEQLAYVVYTSGSTGRPKGVEVS
ncbi:MAG: AMP-binding protein, partial [Gammaproteobacteria bacterium]|nr:AMP-binding protein [Gemmatimonadota bacterium]NIS36025.1 AMP-binding protein [Actinomycetota bacterium]NIU74761.1 AMP-binding protein [Gammaproteobacteria bacterium]